ncbi:uncharacterized protein SPPG_03309 [Spizellomyces punctatus DAOM BR117]|uniref:Uncharacterized protein n=1 Tax=Spizellomyces punctatus (strain DAOM BR117) TaxID=645134 RepID=A0A0L0HK76_SPIPD|nr:uncharacterized protein SPPG_03309 [Spizellomyces punctatus DAOM BR117]KND01512.1 hypothetical protein SPPG_03309 [Spizellomyces punctatus DAOM BR117]|eukprot:XP_016609551.1 hypothetical protein SPPG_03309 [Spizellomyces punctatus DAOM BR117]
MTLIFNPIEDKNVRVGTKNYVKMMRKLVAGDFNRKGWTRERKVALEDLMIERLPLFLLEEQEKRRDAARKAQATRTAPQRQAIARKATVTLRRKKMEHDQDLAREMAAQKARRSAAAKQAAETRRSNQTVADYAIEWVHLLYWCEHNDSQFYRERQYTEGNRFAKSKDSRYVQVQALRAEKGDAWMHDIAWKEDEFEEKFSNVENACFRESLSRQMNHVFPHVRGQLTLEKTKQLIEAYETEHGILVLNTESDYNDNFIILETVVLSRVNLSNGVKLDEMMLFDEQQEDGMIIRPDSLPEGQCLINAVRNVWAYGSKRAQRKGCREILDDKWLMNAMKIDSLDNGANLKHLNNLNEEMLKLGYVGSYYCIDLCKAFVSRMQYLQDDIADLSKRMKKDVGKDWKFKWTLPPLYGFIYNNHFSEICDEKLQKSLRERTTAQRVQSEHADTKRKRGSKGKTEEEDEDEEEYEEDYVFIDRGNVEEIVKNILHREVDGNVQSSTDGWRTIYLLKDCKDFFVMESVFLEYIKQTQKIPQCYRTSMYEMPLPYPVFSFFDTVEPYDAAKSDFGKMAGLYFVKTRNVIPCEGDGWYVNAIVDKLCKENIQHEITHMILASRALPGNYFCKYINLMVGALGSKGAKLPINGLVGLFGMKFSKRYFKSVFFPTQEEAVDYFQKWQAEGQWNAAITQKFFRDLHGLDLFQTTAYQNVKTFDSHRPIRKQIMDYANCLLYDMIKETVGGIDKVLAVKTDCIVVRKQDAFINHLWKYHIPEDLPELHKDINTARRADTGVRQRWINRVDLRICKGDDGVQMFLDAIRVGQSARIQGDGSCGKSVLLKGLEKYFIKQGRKVLVIAPTNAAANRVKGKTIHKGLKIGQGDEIAHLKNNIPNVLLIDEISQIPSYLWNIIYIYKQMGCRVFLVRDSKQLPPVEPWENILSDDYLETKLVADIADGNYIRLTENHRFLNDPTNEMHKLTASILNEGTDVVFPDSMYVENESEILDFRLNIAFTNQVFHLFEDTIQQE